MIPSLVRKSAESSSKPRASGDDPVSGRELTPADGNAFSAGDLVNPA